MKATLLVLSLLWVECSIPARAAQATVAPRAQVAGTISSVNAQASQFVMKPDKGDSISVTTTDQTLILHMPPGVTDVKQGTKLTVGELAVGDRVVAYYRGAAGEKAVQATSLVVRTVADLAEIAKQEQADWRRRGTIGIASATDPAAKTVTLKVGSKTVTVKTTDKTEYHRYSLDSAKPADAKVSSFAEIKVGDQVHVLGNRNEDGTETTAESVYAGTFRQLAATITSINATTGEMLVKDLATKKPLTIRVDSDTVMKKLDPDLAASLARRYGAGRAQDQAGAAGAGASAGFAGRGGRGGRGGGGGDIGQILDRLPAAPLSALKNGDAVMVSTTMGSDPTHVTAIMLLAGVDQLLTAPNATRDIMSGWNLNGGGGGGEGN
jgi:hypothetical protein